MPYCCQCNGSGSRCKSCACVKAGRPCNHCVTGRSKNCHHRPLPGNAASSSLPSSLPVSFAQAVSLNNNRSAEVGVSSSCLPQNIPTEDQLRSPCHNEERRTSDVVEDQSGRAEPPRSNSVTSAVVDSLSATLSPQSTLLLKGRFLEKTSVFLATILLAVGVRIQTVQAIPWIRLPSRLAVLVVLL